MTFPSEESGPGTAPASPAPAAHGGRAAVSPDVPAEPAIPAGPASADRPAIPDEPDGLLGAGALRPVSEKLIRARYVAGIVGYVIWLLMIAAAIVGTVLTGWWWIAALGVAPLILLLQSLILTPRRVRAIGYLDAEEDLTIAAGVMFRSVQTIPYGRVQSVKIDEGPVDRRYGLAKLTVTTAAGASSVTLPGLPKEEAERLRELLTDRGIENMAAL
ncbi:PH domain-containing protein [Brachybacterium sp. GCM10030252]|uniref:PH domain-containing protein n=1 Tax=Brachybacterium sp. GCM10030252 TaxID=3273380 RepID=UPI0036060F56